MKLYDIDINPRQLVYNMKLKENKKENIIQKIQQEKSFTIKCIYARKYLPPQSINMELIIKNDLKIHNSYNKISGDGHKNGINYEIKYSGHAKYCKLNIVQIRPDHNIDYYILCYYNMYYDQIMGKGFIFKIPVNKIYELIIKYGGYAHGTIKKLGRINTMNIKGRNCEYAIRCNPNKKYGKNYELWNELLKYEVEYHPDNF